MRTLLVCGALLLAWAAPAQAATCKAPKYPGEGYFTSLTATEVSCSTASKFVVKYYKCRTKTGPAGRCVKRVDGYSCTETRQSIPTEINGRVTCKKGSRRIVHTYQQNT
jgi:hypothetical protein